ncbi:hypothetical protein KIN20_038143 [Parelaphostrongylus tenuis]|uniref:Transposase n=1 Tax=Parelaphostrongylus tenuis TaxID=148309 RepID=A0AAD5RF41_PARTN|nr:hypothetical protein KIN20_038143 [Parelaphostrongylus tenuis]
MEKILDRTAQTLLKVISHIIALGTTIISDSWKACNVIQNHEDKDYEHFHVNHRHHFTDPETSAQLRRSKAYGTQIKANDATTSSVGRATLSSTPIKQNLLGDAWSKVGVAIHSRHFSRTWRRSCRRRTKPN